MGTFDIIVGTCPFCGNAYEGQTKQFDNILKTLKVGEKIAKKIVSMRMELKDECCSCRCTPVAVIYNGVLVSLEKDNPDLIERLWGGIEEPAEKSE
jgi:hypothetical protein